MNIVGIHTSLNKYQVKPTIANRIKPSGLARNKRNDITMINRIIKIALVFLFTLTAQFSFAQTASLLPNGMQQFFDNDGNPLSSGTVDFYIPSTTTRKNTWQNSTETIVNTNPVVLDAAGRAIIYGDGVYRQILKDRLGNTIWDKTTTSNVTGGTIITTGDGDLVGTVKPWAGIIAPNQYAFSFGQEVSRTTYSALLTAITQSATVICTSASNTITGLADTTQVPVGAKVELTCVPAGTTVVSKTVSSLTLSNPANVSINATAVIFPFGNGNGTTTFNIPDLRGYVVAGRDNMGGSAANRFSTFFGTNSASATGQTGGSPSLTVALANLPSHNHTIYDPGHTHLLAVGNDSASSGTFQQSSNNTKTQLTASSTTGIITQNSGGSGLAVSATLDAAGSGYTNGAQVLTVSGGTCSVQPTFNVTVAGNVVTAIVSLANAGNCTVIPANPVSTTGGGGTNATLNVAFTAQPISQVQPTITLNYIIKITPDTSAQAASGVSDINGMIGSIGCGTGISCTGNLISLGTFTIPFSSVTSATGFPNTVTATQTVAPTITSANCGNKVLLGGGTFYSFSVSAVSGFPAGCTIQFVNVDPMPTGANSTGAKVITITGINGCTTSKNQTYVWPKQTMEITSDSSSSLWIITKCPGLWEMPGNGNFTLNVDPSLGSDTWGASDGLGLTTRAFASMGFALGIAAETMQENFQFQTSLITKCVASCTDNAQIHWPGHGGTPAGAQGGAGTIVDCNGGTLSGGVQLFFQTTLAFQNCTFATNPVFATQNAVMVLAGATNTLNSVLIQLSEGARIRCLGCTINIIGSFSNILQMSAAASIIQINFVQTGNVTYSDTAFRVQSGSFASISSWTTNGFTATGSKYQLIECATMEGTALIAGSVAGAASCTQAN